MASTPEYAAVRHESNRRQPSKGCGTGGASLLGDVREGVEVLSGEAAGWHARAYPKQALLLLRVDAKHVPSLPDVVVLNVNLPTHRSENPPGL